jgi:predicted anti-sigma-YlaC factor YlaD
MTTAVDDLACKEFVELVTEYLEGTMSAAGRARVDLHLRGCPFCTAYLEQMLQTIATIGSLPRSAVDPKAMDALLDAFRKG